MPTFEPLLAEAVDRLKPGDALAFTVDKVAYVEEKKLSWKLDFKSPRIMQETYDTIVAHLREQHRRCSSNGACRYRISRKGKPALCCAAGCLIPDTNYRRWIENVAVYDTLYDPFREGLLELTPSLGYIRGYTKVRVPLKVSRCHKYLSGLRTSSTPGVKKNKTEMALAARVVPARSKNISVETDIDLVAQAMLFNDYAVKVFWPTVALLPAGAVIGELGYDVRVARALQLVHDNEDSKYWEAGFWIVSRTLGLRYRKPQELENDSA